MEKTTTQELLAQAEKICAQRNVRLTPQRLEDDWPFSTTK